MAGVGQERPARSLACLNEPRPVDEKGKEGKMCTGRVYASPSRFLGICVRLKLLLVVHSSRD